MRKVFLDDLPRKEGIGALKGKQVIDWKGSIGCKVRFIYDDIEDKIEIMDYNKKKCKVLLSYKNNKKWKSTSNLIHLTNLSSFLGMNAYEKRYKKHIYDVGDFIDTNNRYFEILDTIRIKDRNSVAKAYRYKCLKCGNIDIITEGHLKEGNGCGACKNRKIIKGINDISTTNPEWLPFIKNIDDAYINSNNSSRKICFKCPDCGNEKMITPNRFFRSGLSCGKCGDGISIPNKTMHNILQQMQIKFECEKRFYWCKFKKYKKEEFQYGVYDFYFEKYDKKYIIEMDGDQHKNESKSFPIKLDEQKYIDNMKNKLAKEHDIIIIRIDCSNTSLNFIKTNILNSELKYILNLNNVNWVKCWEYTYKSLIKSICDYWNDKEDWETTKDLANIFNIHRGTITRYLKQGTELGWCNYNPKEEKYKNIKRKNKNGKAVRMYRDGEFVGEFPSCHELDRVSLSMFGERLIFSYISEVARGIKNKYKGFTFKYVENNE